MQSYAKQPIIGKVMTRFGALLRPKVDPSRPYGVLWDMCTMVSWHTPGAHPNQIINLGGGFAPEGVDLPPEELSASMDLFSSYLLFLLPLLPVTITPTTT